MRVLVACEFSQVVCKAFRARGLEAYSCDLLPTEGNPDWHIQDDVLKHLDDGWDLMIAHPPCTYLSRAGAIIKSHPSLRCFKTSSCICHSGCPPEQGNISQLKASCPSFLNSIQTR